MEATVKKVGCAKQEMELKPRQTARNETYLVRRKRERDVENIGWVVRASTVPALH